MHAIRPGMQFRLNVHQMVYFSDSTDAGSVTRPTMEPFDLKGTVDGVRKEAKGFLLPKSPHELRQLGPSGAEFLVRDIDERCFGRSIQLVHVSDRLVDIE
jgi:hypothetical protein